MKNKKIDIESIERKNIHQVPDGYFDDLPLKIQSRITQREASTPSVFVFIMRLAGGLTAAAVIFVLGWYNFPTQNNSLSADEILASIQSEDLIEYLYEENISTEDILASVDEDFLIDEVDYLETEIMSKSLSDEELESIYSEMDYSIELL